MAKKKNDAVEYGVVARAPGLRVITAIGEVELDDAGTASFSAKRPRSSKVERHKVLLADWVEITSGDGENHTITVKGLVDFSDGAGSVETIENGIVRVQNDEGDYILYNQQNAELSISAEADEDEKPAKGKGKGKGKAPAKGKGKGKSKKEDDEEAEDEDEEAEEESEDDEDEDEKPAKKGGKSAKGGKDKKADKKSGKKGGWRS